MKKAPIAAIVVGGLSFLFTNVYASTAAAPAAEESRLGYYSPSSDAASQATDSALDEVEKTLPGGHIKMSGKYRIAAGVDSDDVILNEANAELQEKNYRYVFGEELENTHDRAIYSQYLLNVDFSPRDRLNFYTQIVNDPWSWVGTTGEQVQRSDIGGETIRYNLKYFGATNSTLPEIYRTDVSDSVAIPAIKVVDGHLTAGTVSHGFYDFNPATGGIPFSIPELPLDFEYRPIRKLWMDYVEDDWHLRVFALADQSQALTSDDPLGLSNHIDYWQQSPWLYEYKPIMHFVDGSVKRGYYDDALSFNARDSEGNRLVLLRGASFEAYMDDTYLAATVAAPFSPWDENYFDANNIPGAIRLKHRSTDVLTLGALYTFRTGLIDNSIADLGQTGAFDAAYKFDENTELKGQVAMTHRDRDLLSDPSYQSDNEGYAYKAQFSKAIDHEGSDRHTDINLSYTQMDRQFEPQLSRYSDTRDDNFWGKHLYFQELDPGLEYMKIGDGVDRNRIVVRAQWREKLFMERFQNLFDVRNVHKTTNTAYMETVLRDEAMVKINEQWTAKGLFRWHGMPKTTDDVEPFLSSFYFVGYEDPASLVLQNVDVEGGKDADRFTYAGALQYVMNEQWTFEGFYEISNDISDFPRGLLNGAFRNTSERVDGILTDRVTTFLYGQGPLNGLPPYKYFNVFRERAIFKPVENLKFTLHATQNQYKFSGGIDDEINHEGMSVEYDLSEKIKFFFDYTHSRVIDLPRMIANNYTVSEFDDHHNVYASFDYKINASTVFRSEYGVFGIGANTPQVSPYSTTTFSLPTLDTEHLLRLSLNGDF